MSNAYKLIEVVGTSTESYDQAIRNAVAEAQKTLTGLLWFEVAEFRGAIRGTKLEYQATVKMGFRLKT